MTPVCTCSVIRVNARVQGAVAVATERTPGSLATVPPRRARWRGRRVARGRGAGGTCDNDSGWCPPAPGVAPLKCVCWSICRVMIRCNAPATISVGVAFVCRAFFLARPAPEPRSDETGGNDLFPTSRAASRPHNGRRQKPTAAPRRHGTDAGGPPSAGARTPVRAQCAAAIAARWRRTHRDGSAGGSAGARGEAIAGSDPKQPPAPASTA